MSKLQIILEEDTESALKRRKKQCGTTVVYRPNVAKPPEAANHASTSHLQSEDESCDELDSEVKKIKEMTSNLQLRICSELKHHKRAYQQYIESNKALNSLAKSYTTEIEEVKSTAQLALVESIQTCSELKRIRENIAGGSRCSNENEENYLEVLNNMKKEIQNMQEKLYTNELIIEDKQKENTDLKNFIETYSEKNRSYLESQGAKVGCSKCRII